MSTEPALLSDGAVTLRPRTGDDPHYLHFDVEHRGEAVGEVTLLLLEDQVGQLTWATTAGQRRQGLATRAVRLLTRYALQERGLARVQAYVDPGDVASMRIAGRSGLRREGVLRGLRTPQQQATEVREDLVVFARLADDPAPHEPEGFRALLNAGLPRKRVIAQLAVRDTGGRLLLCRLSYKPDWDLPGGVVEVGESPRDAAAREVEEELALTLPAGDLLLVDWLPPWSGWDDACTLVFDGGVHSPGLVDTVVPEPREILEAQFCDADQIHERCARQTARRALAALQPEPHRPRYLESGHRPDAADEGAQPPAQNP
jgi:8-oxo-dGTP pyrophosphatase MutT (NUDIX family)